MRSPEEIAQALRYLKGAAKAAVEMDEPEAQGLVVAFQAIEWITGGNPEQFIEFLDGCKQLDRQIVAVKKAANN